MDYSEFQRYFKILCNWFKANRAILIHNHTSANRIKTYHFAAVSDLSRFGHSRFPTLDTVYILFTFSFHRFPVSFVFAFISHQE